MGIRAVGRARRVGVVEGGDGGGGGEGGLVMGSSTSNSEGSGSGSTGTVSTSGNEMGESSYYLYGRKKTAIEDIHVGQCEEFRDDDDNITTIMDLDAALECVSNIKSLLMSTSSSTAQQQLLQQQQQQSSSEGDGKLLQRRMLFDKAYEAMELHLEEASSSCGNALEHRNHQLEAYSWAAFAACDDFLTRSSPSIVVRALETKDTLERLRLGVAMLLDSQMRSLKNDNDDNFAKMTTRHGANNAVVGDNDANSFQ